MTIQFIELGTFIIFLLLSAYFSSTETAFTAINRIRLKKQFEHDDSDKVPEIEGLLSKPADLITAILIGNNVSNVAATAIGTTMLLQVFESFNITNLAIIMPLITLIIAIFLLIFGEITPKTMALTQPERYALFSYRFLKPLTILLTPVIVLFRGLNSLINKLFNINEDISNHRVSLDELKLMVDISHDDGIIQDEKNKMLTSIFEFSETIVREIMTPRTDAVCISSEESIQSAINLLITKGHSRIPVYEDKLDNIVGVVYAKDLLGVSKSNSDQRVSAFMRTAIFIPEFKPVDNLLQQMKTTKFHMAIVVDEYGGMSGLVTLEDIVEEIIGEIQDEHDHDQKKDCIEINNSVYDVNAKMNIRDLEEIIQYKFPEDVDYDTLGGFVLSHVGEFPSKGDVFDFNNLTITVKDVKKRRIIRLEIKKNPLP